MSNIFVARDGKATGPFSVEQLRSMLDAKMISIDDLACRPGDTNWRRLEEVLDLDATHKDGSGVPTNQAAVVKSTRKTADHENTGQVPNKRVSAKTYAVYLIIAVVGVLALEYYTGRGFVGQYILALVGLDSRIANIDANAIESQLNSDYSKLEGSRPIRFVVTSDYRYDEGAKSYGTLVRITIKWPGRVPEGTAAWPQAFNHSAGEDHFFLENLIHPRDHPILANIKRTVLANSDKGRDFRVEIDNIAY